MRLRGKVALITGAGSGIGRATARLFASEGAYVVVADVAEAAGRETVELIREANGETFFIATDVTRSQDIKTMVEKTVSTCGKLDVLHNNAGIDLAKTIEETSEVEWDSLMAVNLTSVFLCCKYAIPHMARSGGGSIISTASVGGLVGSHTNAAYCASKGGIVALTKAMALDCATRGIRVNCICPGVTATPMWQRWRDGQKSPEARSGRSDELMHPLCRVAQPQEIAAAALFLASDESSFVTGIAFPVDGGLTAQGDVPPGFRCDR